MTASHRAFLSTFLQPLQPFLSRRDVTDIHVNRPGEVWLETRSGVERHDVPGLDDATLLRIARQVAAASGQGISREHPLLAATLPDGARIQVCAPPATLQHVAVSIRQHQMPDLSLKDYASLGSFDGAARRAAARARRDDSLVGHLAAGRAAEFLREAVRGRKTILLSGGTGSGKTTFLNALMKEAETEERIIVIEDTPELSIPQPNACRLIAVRGRLGEASVDSGDLVEAALRMRPDRIIMGELRGAEAFNWLRAVGTGHPGSITTLHASSIDGALDQLALMALMARSELRRDEILSYVQGVIDVGVQLERDAGNRLVSDIVLFRPGGTVRLSQYGASAPLTRLSVG
jgi:type IV secretion system protein VirB11